MYLQAIFYVSIVLSSLFLILLFRTFSFTKLKEIYWRAVEAGTKKSEFLQKVQKHTKMGLKEFLFDAGETQVWARNQRDANFKYQVAKLKLKAAARKKNMNRKKSRNAFLSKREIKNKNGRANRAENSK